jgi:hypothetical protein
MRPDIRRRKQARKITLAIDDPHLAELELAMVHADRAIRNFKKGIINETGDQTDYSTKEDISYRS